MVRLWRMARWRRRSAPHPRGDGPPAYQLDSAARLCSPPAWGCSVICVQLDIVFPVFPPRVGSRSISTGRHCAPRRLFHGQGHDMMLRATYFDKLFKENLANGMEEG